MRDHERPDPEVGDLASVTVGRDRTCRDRTVGQPWADRSGTLDPIVTDDRQKFGTFGGKGVAVLCHGHMVAQIPLILRYEGVGWNKIGINSCNLIRPL